MGQLIGSIRFWWFVPLIMFLFWVPQLFYWKYITGQWVFYSYTGYGFSHWKSPYIGSVLFSIQNGFFVYSPIMLFAVLGLGLGLKKKIHSSPGVSLILLISIYLFASWEAWWFGGAYGHRAFIDLFPFLSLGSLAGICAKPELAFAYPVRNIIRNPRLLQFGFDLPLPPSLGRPGLDLAQSVGANSTIILIFLSFAT
jgi:hypothetical protein